MSVTTRLATRDDLDTLLTLIDQFAATHRSANHPRPRNVMAEAFFGEGATLRFVLAEWHGEIVGLAGWRPVFDYFWAMRGAEAEGLFVLPRYRRLGIAAVLISSLCADVRDRGGVFLRATYDTELAGFYERVAMGHDQRSGHLSADAFHAMADLAGVSPRSLIGALPPPELNRRNTPR